MITIISGTNRTDSVSEQIANQYKEILIERRSAAEVISLCDLPVDYLTSALYENAGKNDDFNTLRDKMNGSEKFVFVIPEYNGSFPGVLKTFIDGLDRAKALDGKKSALLGLSAGDQGAGLALSHFTDILNYCGTNVLAYRLRIPGVRKVMTDNKITNPDYVARLNKQADLLLQF